VSPHRTPEAAIVLRRWTVTSGSNVTSRAAVVLRTGSQGWDAAGEGNGPVDALFAAVDRALADVLGGRPRLVGYDVHALGEGPGAEGRVTVSIVPPAGASGDRGVGRYTGEATSTNTIAASLEAYVAALNAMLGDASWAGAAQEASARRSPARAVAPAPAGPAEWVEPDGDVDPHDWFNR
jgi:hypothetical protein